MRLVSRAVHPLLVCLAFAVVVQAAPCCVAPAPLATPILSVLIPESVSDRWYACRGVAEEDLGVIISLRMMPIAEAWAAPPNYPIDVMREVLYEMIDEDDLPDMAMIPRELAREISDRCYVYDLDAFECWIAAPFFHNGAIDGVVLPWASDLVAVFFEPGENVLLGLSLLSHPTFASLRSPDACCDWPAPEPEPESPCCP